MPNVLLVTPKLNIQGGVVEFNKMLIHYSNSSIKPFFLSTVGKNYNKIYKVLFLIIDVFRFFSTLLRNKIQIVHLGPSLNANAIYRDGIFCLLSKIVGIKVYVHWHGWNPSNEYLFKRINLLFLKQTIFKADHIKFLSEKFQKRFIDKGYRNKTSLGNTFIDDKLLSYYKLEQKVKSRINILFLSTISKNKGIFIAIKAFEILALKYDLKLTVVGNGPDLLEVKNNIPEHLVSRIEFKGFLIGNEKVEEFKNADIYLFPSFYEGMPTSLIEALGFGLPVVTSSVGAIPDFFLNEKMGFIVNELTPVAFANELKKLIESSDLRYTIGEFNYQFVQQHFFASKAIDKIDKDYKNLIE